MIEAEFRTPMADSVNKFASSPACLRARRINGKGDTVIQRERRDFIRERILELTASSYPARFRIMLEEGLLVVEDKVQQADLCDVACIVSSAAWEGWLCKRGPEDNRQEHEWVVFANVMKIAQAENLPLSDKRIATAFSFLHDTCFLKRIMEEEIRKVERAGRLLEAEELKRKKKSTRFDHMVQGAKNAATLLPTLYSGSSSALRTPLFTAEEIQRCVDIIAVHDAWKVDPPEPPPTEDRLLLACVEADVLWPMHPIGVLADLERANDLGETQDFSDPAKWLDQIHQSNHTILEFRRKWQGIPDGDFIDGESIFRTREGARLYHEWLCRWGLGKS